MAKTTSQIFKELNASFDPTRKVINQQLGGLDASFDSSRKGLEAQKQKAFSDITTGAKRRGLKFSGIPLAEQAEFTTRNFLPALAELERDIGGQRSALQLALADLTREQGTLAQSLRQTALDREAQDRRAAASRAAQFNVDAVRKSFEQQIRELQKQLTEQTSARPGSGAPVSQTRTPLLDTSGIGSGGFGNFLNSVRQAQRNPVGDLTRSVDANGNVTLLATPRF